MTMELGEGEREFVRTKIEAAFKLLGIPDWAAMVSEEAAFAFRISIPIPEYIFLARGSEVFDSWPHFSEFGEIGLHCSDSGLLQHDFAEPYAVGIRCWLAGLHPPWQVAGMAIIPVEKC